MKTLTRILLAAMLMSLLSQSALAAVLERVTSQRSSNGGDVVNLVFDGRGESKIFSLPGDSPRLIFDFPGVRYHGPPQIAVDGALVKTVRVAAHQDPPKTRVVFDLVPGHNVDYHQEFLTDSRTLRITLFDKSATPAVQPQAPRQAVAPAETTQPPPVAVSSPVKAATTAPTEVASPTVKEVMSPPKVKAATTVPTEVASPTVKEVTPPPKPEPLAEAAPLAAKSAGTTRSPFDSPFLAEDESALPEATRMLGYSMAAQPTGGDVLHLQLDGYASPKISAHEGHKPQVICFFPQMRLDVNKKPRQPLSGKFVQKVAVSAQKQPAGVQVTLDLEAGYDYNIQQIFVKDESTFLLIVNVLKP